MSVRGRFRRRCRCVAAVSWFGLLTSAIAHPPAAFAATHDSPTPREPQATTAAPYPPTTGDYPPSPTGCSVTAGITDAGVSVIGSSFVPHSSIVLRIGGRNAGSAEADENGWFTETVPNVANGGSTLVANSGQLSCSARIITTRAGADPAATRLQAVRSAPTATTGFPVLKAVVIALALVGTGLLIVLIGRRARA